MAMQARQLHAGLGHDFGNGGPGRTVFVIKTKTIPEGINPGVHIDAKGDPGFEIFGRQDLRKLIQFIEVVDVNKGPVLHGKTQIIRGFIGAVEENLVAGNPVPQGFAVFKNADHFGPRAFFMKNPANGVEIIGFVGPGHLHFGIAGTKSPDGVAIGLADGLFG